MCKQTLVDDRKFKSYIFDEFRAYITIMDVNGLDISTFIWKFQLKYILLHCNKFVVFAI